MRIIPVLDLKGGVVVRARQGRRDLYQPIDTPLAPSASVRDVAEGLRGLHPFDTFYIADLDAIEHERPDAATIEELSGIQPSPALWVDAGLSDPQGFERALQKPSVHPVLGTESQNDASVLAALAGHPRLILSLDFFSEGYRGPPDICRNPDLWPQTVIVMTLGRVGIASGPDFERLRSIREVAGNRMLVAAGGIRGERDLRDLAAMGIQAALMATALHDGSLTAAQLATFGA